MADQGVSNERKRELEQMDPFQEFVIKASAYVKANSKMLALGAGSLVAVVAILIAIFSGFEKSENKASALYGKSLLAYQKLAADPVAAQKAVKADFERLLDEYANTGAGRMALVKYGRICLEAGEYDRATQLFEKALDTLKGGAGMETLILSALGHVKLAEKDLKAAEGYFQQVLKKDSGVARDEARFILAGLREQNEDKAGARDMYQALVEKDENSLFAPLAEGLSARLN